MRSVPAGVMFDRLAASVRERARAAGVSESVLEETLRRGRDRMLADLAPLEAVGAVAPRREVVYYATYTSSRRNLAALAAAGIAVIVGPDQLDRMAGYPALRYAIDNGAWGAFRSGGAFDDARFWRVLERWGEVRQSIRRPDWIVCPDIVGGGMASLSLSLRWLPYVRQYGPPLLAVQNGMLPEHVEEHVGPRCGIFIGGTTEWKWATLPTWAAMAHLYGAYLHVGRVNGARRLRLCGDYGVSSADGTSASRYSVNAPRLAAACRVTRR